MWPVTTSPNSVAPFPHLQNRDIINTDFVGFSWGLNKLIAIKYLEQYLAHNKWPIIFCWMNKLLKRGILFPYTFMLPSMWRDIH